MPRSAWIDVAMAGREADRSLVPEHGDVALRREEHVRQLLLEPPPVLALGAVLVIADVPEVERRRVEHVAIEVEDRPIGPAPPVDRELGVAMRVPAQDLELSTVDPRAPAADARDVRGLVGVARRAIREGWRLRLAGQEPRLRLGLEPPGVDVLLDRLLRERELDREGGPVVARPGQPQPAALGGRRADAHREASGRERNESRLAPSAIGHGGDVGLPVLDARAPRLRAHHQVHASALVDRELRRAHQTAPRVSLLPFAGRADRREQRPDLRLRRGEAPVAAAHPHFDLALGVERRSGLAALVDQPAVVLAPALLPDLVRHPDPILAVDRDRRPRLEEVAGRDGDDRARSAGDDGAADDVVVAAVVGVPERRGRCPSSRSRSQAPSRWPRTERVAARPTTSRRRDGSRRCPTGRRETPATPDGACRRRRARAVGRSHPPAPG